MDWEQYGQDWQNLHGCVPRVSTDFNPGAAPWPGSQAMRRCLIMNPDRIIVGRHCQGRPAQVAFSLNGGNGSFLRVVACAARHSAVRAVTRTAGMKFTRCVEGELTPSPLYCTKPGLKRNLREKIFYKIFKLNFVFSDHPFRNTKFLGQCLRTSPLLTL